MNKHKGILLLGSILHLFYYCRTNRERQFYLDVSLSNFRQNDGLLTYISHDGIDQLAVGLALERGHDGFHDLSLVFC